MSESETVQSFSDVGFCCIVGLSGLQIDWPMSLGFKYIFPFLNVIYYLQVFHFKNGGKNNIKRCDTTILFDTKSFIITINYIDLGLFRF